MKISLLSLGIHNTSDLISLAQKIEQAGCDTLWLADERFYMDTYSSLAICAASTERIGLGPGVTDPYSRHPALTAMAIGTLDRFSNGRAVLGLGAGVSGFNELYINREKAPRAIEETVYVVRHLLMGEEVCLDGAVIKLHHCKLDFTIYHQPQIIIASNGKQITKLAGKIADGVMSSSVLIQPLIKDVIENAESGLRIYSRKRSEFTIWSRLNISINNNSELAIKALKPIVYNFICSRYPNTTILDRLNLILPDDLRQLIEKIGITRDPEKLDLIFPKLPDEFVEKTCLVGRPEKIIRQIQYLENEGFDGVILYPVPSENQAFMDILDLILERVVPFVI